MCLFPFLKQNASFCVCENKNEQDGVFIPQDNEVGYPKSY